MKNYFIKNQKNILQASSLIIGMLFLFCAFIGFGEDASGAISYSLIAGVSQYGPGRTLPTAPAEQFMGNNVFFPQQAAPIPQQYLPYVNQFQLPRSFSVSVASLAGGGSAANTRVTILQGATITPVTTNGSGAASITYAYNDGYSGNVLSQYLAFDRQGMGAIMYGLALRVTLTSSGAGAPAVLGITNPKVQTFNTFGDYAVTNFNPNDGQTRRDEDTSIAVMPCLVNLSMASVVSFLTVVLYTFVATVYLDQNF